MLSWPQLEGRVAGDGYRLNRYLNGSETAGRFEARLETKTGGTEPRDVRVELFALTPRQARERFELWRSLQLLSRPEILKIIASGSADWPDLHFEYLVTEVPDETLAGALQERPLNDVEARQVLESVSRALAIMHDRQCVHASVQPANIFAVGDAIKLGVSTVQRPGASDILAEPSDYQAPEVGSFAFSPASDIWSLGVTLFQTLTRELPGDDAAERAALLPAPFSEILKHSLDPIPAKRWTARQILEHLGAPVPEHPPVLDKAPPPSSPPADRVDLGLPKRSFPVSPYAIAAIVLFLAFLWMIFGHKSSQRHVGPPSPQPAAAQTPVPTPTPIAPSAPARSTPARSASATPPPSHQPILQKENVPVRTPSSANGPVNWRVVAFTYARESDAAAKAASLNQSNPDLHAQVFSPQPGRFVVSIGGWMDVNEAKRVRQEALAKGLPHDTYAQNFHRE
ncbi:MAG TPA: protein kinase [Bryobacteraceae bacterium]|nr:protein kinase [Bryobacteraceae bacterium]